MLELLRALIFGQVITLAPAPATIGTEPITLTTEAPIEALNPGARLSINVSSVVPVTELMETMRRTEELFPTGCIRAFGVQVTGETISLKSQSVALSGSAAYVQLAQEGGANVKVKFSAIKVASCRSIPGATVEWANYGE